MEDKRRTLRESSSSSSSSSSSGSSSGSESSSGPASPASPGSGAPRAESSSSNTAAGSGGNAFANDGSFMELFKKKMEEERRRKEQEEEEAGSHAHTAGERKPVSVASFVGKRRGGAKLALKTGVVAKKQKPDSEAEKGKGDAWSKYMAEVKKYKAHQCGDDDKTRPLVK
ncbi:telomerase RNA component interacting RNase [Clarias gariepinus]|uniref:telomerase RNA component interacting RNase n=1 Tax=Clarias gariepinus TaxID=13013 RepID=UPI00234C8854|nr:telomerase RNA component interacting RNase [Clarias gariepinus]